MGKMPFAVLFEWQEDGSLRSHSALNRETYIDLHFVRDGKGGWILHEEATMEGSAGQRYSLVPTDGPGELVRWVYAQDPDYLTIDMSVDRQALFMDVRVRGKEHVQFKLGRLPTQEWPELKRELAAMAEQAPGEGTSIFDAVSDEEIPPPIREARRLLASQPQEARSHLGLAQAIGHAIQADGAANGPRFAFEMLQALQDGGAARPRPSRGLRVAGRLLPQCAAHRGWLDRQGRGGRPAAGRGRSRSGPGSAGAGGGTKEWRRLGVDRGLPPGRR